MIGQVQVQQAEILPIEDMQNQVSQLPDKSMDVVDDDHEATPPAETHTSPPAETHTSPPPLPPSREDPPSARTTTTTPSFDPSRMIGIVRRKALIKELAAGYHAECLAYCQELLDFQTKWEEPYLNIKVAEHSRKDPVRPPKRMKKTR